MEMGLIAKHSAMTIDELQIKLDISSGNELIVLKQYAHETSYGYIFVDLLDGHCYLYDIYGKLDDINKVKSIGNSAFWNCVSLKNVVIPDSVKSIGYFTFKHCTSLKSIIIPDSVESIGKNAFGRCALLKEVIFKGKTTDQVKAIYNYPWGIKDTNIIKCQMS